MKRGRLACGAVVDVAAIAEMLFVLGITIALR